MSKKKIESGRLVSMKEYVLSEQYQIRIPRLSGAKPGDRFLISEDNGKIILIPVK